jgi:hypothetical protein
MRKPEYREESRKRKEEAFERLKTKGKRELSDYDYISADPVLHELLEPERQRQKKEMLKAIDQICKLIHEA